MTSTSTHACVYFDDGDLDLLCSCGQRAMYPVEDGAESVLVVLTHDHATVTALLPPGVASKEHFAVSA